MNENELMDARNNLRLQLCKYSYRQGEIKVNRHLPKIDCSQPSIFSYFILLLNAWIESEENWTPAQNGRLEVVVTEKNIYILLGRFARKPDLQDHVLRANFARLFLRMLE